MKVTAETSATLLHDLGHAERCQSDDQGFGKELQEQGVKSADRTKRKRGDDDDSSVKKPKQGDENKTARKAEKYGYDSATGVYHGRPDFNKAASKIKPNQDPAHGPLEDRRHQLAWEGIGRFLGDTRRMIARMPGQDGKMADALLTSYQKDYYPSRTGKSPAGLGSMMNSNPGNLFLGSADENKAVELLRSDSKSFLKSMDKYAAEPPKEGVVLQEARDYFAPHGASRAGIGGLHDEMKGHVHRMLGHMKTDVDAVRMVHDMQFNGFFDIDHRTRPEHTGKALDLAQRMHSANLNPEGTGIEDRLKLIREFAELKHTD